MPTSQTIAYPAVQAIFDRELKKLTNGQKNSLLKNIGKRRSTFFNYRNGLRNIPDEVLDTIAANLRKNDPAGQAALREELASALRERETTGSFLDDVASGARLLKVTSVADYSPIAGSDDCFYENLMRRFSKLVGCTFNPQPRPMEQRKTYSDDEVLLGLFNSLDRMWHLKFWRIPIRLTIGGICDRRYASDRDAIAEVLSHPGRKTLRMIRPIVVAGEVGEIHCRQSLNFTDTEMRVEKTLSSTGILRCLDEETEKAQATGIIPVLCVDEVSAFQVLSLMGKRGISVFEINSLNIIRSNPASRELPQYYSSIAIRRGNMAFQGFMQDALSQFLASEVETTAHLWVELAKLLIRQLVHIAYFGNDEAERWAIAWQWVEYALHLDHTSIQTYEDPDSLPWKPILSRARRLMRDYFVSERDTILISQVNLARSKIAGAELGTRDRNGFDMASICDLFDLSESDAEHMKAISNSQDEEILIEFENMLKQ